MALFLKSSPRLNYISEALLGSIISAAASATAAGVSAGSAVYKNKKQFEYAKKMAAYQNELNQSAWQMQQEYNTPAAQMQRYMDAGLSPNLLYGSVSSGNASSAPQLVAPQEQAPDFQQAISYALSAANIEAQNRLLTAQAKKVELENTDTQAKQEGYGTIDETHVDDDGKVHRYTGLSGFYAYTKELQYMQARKNLTLTDWKILLTQSQRAIADIDSKIAAATKDDQEILIQKSAQLKAATAALQEIILENNEYLQDFNQKSPYARLAVMLLQSITNIVK